MKYWLTRDGAKQGPYSAAELTRMVIRGSAGLSDLVWGEGAPLWSPLWQILPVTAGVSSAIYPVEWLQTDAWPLPPRLHWSVVLALTVVTLGGFGLFWLFVQAHFAKRLDPANRSAIPLSVGVLFLFATVLLSLAGASEDNIAPLMTVSCFGAIYPLTHGIFGIRTSLERHYTDVEPIELQLVPELTFFLNVLYIQHHLSKIAAWKQPTRLF